MKVLQINSFFTVGGPPRIMNGIYDTLKEQGIECRIAAAREKMYAPEDSIRIGTGFSVKLNAILARIFDNEGFSAKRATKKLIKQIEEYDPDIIHLHNLHGYYINIEMLFDYLKKCNKKIVWTLHDCWAMTGHCPHSSMVKCDKWLNGCYQCPLKKDYPSSYVLDRSGKNWKRKKEIFNGVPNLTLVCVSKWLESVVKKSFLSNYGTKVIYNGIDLSSFKSVDSDFRSKYGIEDKKVLLGVAMRWLPRKGLDDYRKLAEQLDENTVIVMVGLTAEECKNMPSNIIGVPPTNNDTELAEIYSAADICLNLSYEETFGLTSVEALSCGTPIVTYDQTAVPEVSNMFNMPVVHAGDIGALLDAIKSIPRKNESMQTAKIDLSCFEQKYLYQEYLKLYKDLSEGGF